jgi:hypothetical protein
MNYWSERVNGPGRTVSAGLIGFASVCLAQICLPQNCLAQKTAASTQELVRKAVRTELSSPFVTQNCTYEYHRSISGKREKLRMVKSSDLVVGKVIEIGGAPITQSEEKKEDAQLRHLLHDMAEQEQERKRQQKFEQYTRQLMEALPDAFVYRETQTEVRDAGVHLVHLSFQPASNYHPPTTSLDWLQGLSGEMVIDDQRKRIVLFNGELFRDIDFGWGILVHLDRGGKVRLERALPDDANSNPQAFMLDFDARILLVKRLVVQLDFDHFVCLDRNIDLASAVDMLTNPAQLQSH